MRRIFSVIAMMWTVLATAPCLMADAPAAGAIRWDGWWRGNPYSANLDAAEFRDPLPFYATIDEGGKANVVSDDPGVMDKEIEFAHQAGLRYWAFCWYHPDSFQSADRYNYGIRRYLASPRRSAINFCLILQAQHLGKPGQWKETMQRLTGLFREAGYERVINHRPLVYIFYVDALAKTFGDESSARAALKELCDASEAAGAGKPYLVAQIAGDADKATANRLGFDGISAYAVQPGGPAAESPHARLAEYNMQFNDSLLKTGLGVIPTVTSGWDNRPRWANHTNGAESCAYFRAATPDELRRDVASTVVWMRQHADGCPANTFLIYAWNESDEGGWLVPTMLDGTKRIDALRAGLENP